MPNMLESLSVEIHPVRQKIVENVFTWEIHDAVEVCKRIEAMCPEYNCHVALTGGTLYKEGPRKDLDLIFYNIRGQRTRVIPLLTALYNRMGLRTLKHVDWCKKLQFSKHWDYAGGKIDALFPEIVEGRYPVDDN